MPSSSSTPPSIEDTYSCRLPTDVQPDHYDLTLVPDFGTRTFQGHALISVTVKKSVDAIHLNALDLTFLMDDQGKPRIMATTGVQGTSSASVQQATAVELDKPQQRAVFSFAQPLSAGRYMLSIYYTGVLNDNLCGFYYSSYKQPDGQLSNIAVTQFEATDARRAVPCWDEPAIKARFTVTLVVPATHTAISNMPIEHMQVITTHQHHQPLTVGTAELKLPVGSRLYTYYPSPIMSTYLLAFIVGEFEYLSAFTKRGVEVRVYTPIGKVALGKFSLDVSVKCLDFYETLFGSHYPLPKVDVIAIPDFAAGAMENWGAITYREIAVLIDPATSSLAVKQRAARTVCHELAHMWFGNLVTMEWWTYLWLNEGFARFIEHLAVDQIFPEWKIWEGFVGDVIGQALNLDALESSHPIEVPVVHPDQINEIFDTISYAKGASCIRMLSSAVGMDAFVQGLQAYLKKHAYQNTVSADLWKSLTQSSGTDVATLMKTWLGEVGYPVVTIEETSQASDGKRVLKLKQERFLASGEQIQGHAAVWSIPLSIGIVTANNKQVQVIQHIFSKASDELTITAPAAAALKFNYLQTGFYRVQYSAPLLSSLSSVLLQLSPEDRLGLQRDTFSLSLAGRVPISAALDIITALTKAEESNYAVISSFSASLSYLTTLHAEQMYFPQFQQFIRTLYTPAYKKLGWNAAAGEDSLTALYRSLVIGQMGTAGDAEVINEAKSRLTAYVEDETKHPIAGDLRAPIYAIAIKYGGWKEREQLLTLYRRSESAEEKTRVLHSIGGVGRDSPDADKCIKANIEWALSNDVRLGDSPYIIGSIAKNAAGRAAVWHHLTTNWDTIIPRYTKGQNFILASLLSGLLSNHKTSAAVDEWEQWLSAHPIPSADRALQQTAESVRLADKRLNRDAPQLKQYLEQFNSSNGS